MIAASPPTFEMFGADTLVLGGRLDPAAERDSTLTLADIAARHARKGGLVSRVEQRSQPPPRCSPSSEELCHLIFSSTDEAELLLSSLPEEGLAFLLRDLPRRSTAPTSAFRAALIAIDPAEIIPRLLSRLGAPPPGSSADGYS